jgi:CheY-like chemotaxis protein
MLNGDIDIKSTVGVGTEVTIKFPMVVSGPGGSRSDQQSGSDPPSSGSIERTRDDSLKIVTQRAKGKTAMYYRPKTSGADPEIAAITQQAIGRYLSDWYSFTLVNPLKSTRVPNVILVAQSDLPTLLQEVPTLIHESPSTTVVVISPNSNPRFDREDQGFKNVESISYPFGPYKLAKVIRICLDNIDKANITDSSIHETTEPEVEEAREERTEVVQSVDQVRIGSANLVQQGQIFANEEFAPLMLEALSSMSSRSIEQASGFPFPAALDGSTSPDLTKHPIDLPRKTSSRPVSPMITTHTPPPSVLPYRLRPQKPRLLLVDDNKVNLRLLQTFMKKRGYTDIHTAEDGAVSVEAYKAMASADPPHPPDIIFMDISMPVMNGFEATRRIREFEGSLRESLSPMETPPTCMIIALTGLASSRDQSEAFTSGFDLYLVKPISFKSVAKLLDSWERNGGAATFGVPHGSLSGEDVTSGTMMSNPRSTPSH